MPCHAIDRPVYTGQPEYLVSATHVCNRDRTSRARRAARLPAFSRVEVRLATRSAALRDSDVYELATTGG